MLIVSLAIPSLLLWSIIPLTTSVVWCILLLVLSLLFIHLLNLIVELSLFITVSLKDFFIFLQEDFDVLLNVKDFFSCFLYFFCLWVIKYLFLLFLFLVLISSVAIEEVETLKGKIFLFNNEGIADLGSCLPKLMRLRWEFLHFLSVEVILNITLRDIYLQD
jgi:hypothetical protein